MIAKEFFVVSGKGLSQISKVNAFDAALIDANLWNVNLVPVSSIIPPGAKEVKPKPLDDGAIIFTVLGHNSGFSNDEISVGLAWGWADGDKKRIGLIVTEKQNYVNDILLKNKLKKKLVVMAENRGMRLTSYNSKTVSLKIPKNHYGSVLIVFVYCL